MFEIVNIDINNSFENYKNITNISMAYDLPLSDNLEHHAPKFYNTYRSRITSITKTILEEKSIE